MSTTINHNLGTKHVILQATAQDTGEILKITDYFDIEATSTSYLTVFDSPGYGSAVKFDLVIPDYIHDQSTPADIWIITHNLNKAGVLVECYTDPLSASHGYGSCNLIIPTATTILSNNSLVITFSGVVSGGYAAVKGVDLPHFEIGPEQVTFNTEDLVTAEFQTSTRGYLVLKRGNRFMHLMKYEPASLQLVNDNSITATLDMPTIGMVLCTEGDAIGKYLHRTNQLGNIDLTSENSATITFENEEVGMAAVKAVGKLPYYGDLIMSPHYRVELDLSCQPEGTDSLYIMPEDIIRSLVNNFDTVRPASKYSHYSMLLAPIADFSMLYLQMYPTNPDFTQQLWSKCCIPTGVADLSENYIHYQYNEYSKWLIRHDLGTENIIVACYDTGFNLIRPEMVEIFSENVIKVYFSQNVNGFSYVTTVDDTFLQNIAPSATWGVYHDLLQKEIITQYYKFNGTEFIPKISTLVNNHNIRVVWNNNTMGTVELIKTSYKHTQSTPASTWTMNHNLGYRGVIVQCFDSTGNEILPSSLHLEDSYTTITTFASEIEGYAIIKEIGHADTIDSIVDFLENGTFVLGQGTQKNYYDPYLTGRLDIPIVGCKTHTVEVSQDDNYYYVKGIVSNVLGDYPVSEIGLYTSDGRLAFYSYLDIVYKLKETDIAIFYRIHKE